jgi:hypothetical protein
MASLAEKRLRKFFAGFFIVVVVLQIGLFLYMYSTGIGNASQLLLGAVSTVFYYVLSYKGLNIGVKRIITGIDYVEEHPEIMTINFMAVTGVLAYFFCPFALIFLLPYNLSFLVFPITIFVFATALPLFFLVSDIAEGAVVIYVSEQKSPLSAFIKSTAYVPKYAKSEFYYILGSTFFGRYAKVATSFVNIILVAENISATEAVERSVNVSLEKPTVATFMDAGLGTAAIFIGLFMAVPLMISIGLMAVYQPSTIVPSVIMFIPFFIGLIIMIGVGSFPITAGQIALLKIYFDSQQR